MRYWTAAIALIHSRVQIAASAAVDDPPPGRWIDPPGCTTQPQPCPGPGHSGRTFCQSDPAGHQCDSPPRKTPCPPCPKPRAPGCKSAEDCSLGGTCVNGTCHCDSTWKGPHCVQLNLLPANKTAHGYQRGNNFGIQTVPGMPNQSFASWGGQAVYEAGMYHLIFADFETCGLGCWGGASQLARAVSQHPLGPYTKVEVIAPPFHHNPTLNKVPGGPFVITSIGCAPIGGNGSVTNCSSWLPPGHWPPPSPAPEADTLSRERMDGRVADPAAAGVITMLYSDKITGPWKQHPGVIIEPAPLDKWDSFVTNPSLYFFPKCVPKECIVRMSGLGATAALGLYVLSVCLLAAERTYACCCASRAAAVPRCWRIVADRAV